MKNLIRPLTAGALLAATLATVTTTATAHEFSYWFGEPITWSTNSCTMRLSAVSFSSSTVRNAMHEAADLWDDAPSDFNFFVLNNDTSVGLYNGQSESWFTSSQYYLSGAPAIAYTHGFGAHWSESDIMFDSAETWTFGNNKTSATAYFGNGVHFKSTAIHELGHSMGLAHEADTYNVMGDSHRHLCANGSTVRAYPGEDASDGAVELYGLAASRPEDVGISHWRRVGRNGEYSSHDKVRVFREDGTVAERVGVNGEWGYEVEAGERIRVEFAIENNGSTTQRPRIRYYGSTNDFISTGDTLLASGRPTVSRNTVYMRRQTVTVPSSLSSGQEYFIGAILDYDSAIAESNENNNRTYIGLRID